MYGWCRHKLRVTTRSRNYTIAVTCALSLRTLRTAQWDTPAVCHRQHVWQTFCYPSPRPWVMHRCLPWLLLLLWLGKAPAMPV